MDDHTEFPPPHSQVIGSAKDMGYFIRSDSNDYSLIVTNLGYEAKLNSDD